MNVTYYKHKGLSFKLVIGPSGDAGHAIMYREDTGEPLYRYDQNVKGEWKIRWHEYMVEMGVHRSGVLAGGPGDAMNCYFTAARAGLDG